MIPAQVPLHQPERKQEVLDWFQAVYSSLLDHPDDEKRIDTDFIGLSIGYVLDFRG